MFRTKTVLLPAFLVVMATGCDSRPSASDIDMGPAPEQPAGATISAPSTSALSSTTELATLPAGTRAVERVIESCNVEQVNGQAFAGSPLKASRHSPVTITGWVVDDAPSSEIEIRLVNVADATTFRALARTDVARDDVAAAFAADPAVVKPGFNVTFDAAMLHDGNYRIQVVVPSAENGPAACDNGRVISISN